MAQDKHARLVALTRIEEHRIVAMAQTVEAQVAPLPLLFPYPNTFQEGIEALPQLDWTDVLGLLA